MVSRPISFTAANNKKHRTWDAHHAKALIDKSEAAKAPVFVIAVATNFHFALEEERSFLIHSSCFDVGDRSPLLSIIVKWALP